MPGQPGELVHGRLGALRVPAALAIVLVRVDAVVRATALGLEVVDHQRQHFVVVQQPEALRQRLPVSLIAEGAGVLGRRLPGFGHHIIAVEQPHGDGVAAQPGLAMGHEAPRRPQSLGQFGDRRVRPVAVVLDFHQTDDVRVQRGERRHQLGFLARQLLGVIGAAGGGETAALAVAVEEVKHIEGGHPQVAARRPGRRRRARIGGAEGHRVHRLQPPLFEAVADNGAEVGVHAVADP